MLQPLLSLRLLPQLPLPPPSLFLFPPLLPLLLSLPLPFPLPLSLFHTLAQAHSHTLTQENTFVLILKNIGALSIYLMTLSLFLTFHHCVLGQMHLSFSLSGSESGASLPVGGQVIHLFLESVGVTLTEVQDVVFR